MSAFMMVEKGKSMDTEMEIGTVISNLYENMRLGQEISMSSYRSFIEVLRSLTPPHVLRNIEELGKTICGVTTDSLIRQYHFCFDQLSPTLKLLMLGENDVRSDASGMDGKI